MATRILRAASRDAWNLAKRQHWVISRQQLLILGFTPEAIRQRVKAGRLYPVHRGVYAVGRRELTPPGRWMAAVLSCGDDAVISHGSAAQLWGIVPADQAEIHVSVPPSVSRRRPSLVIHRSALARHERTIRHMIPVTSPTRTLVDVATEVPHGQLERMINEADKLGLTDPERLRSAVERMPARSGVRLVREILDRATFVLTDSELERRFLPIARRAGLPLPQTGAHVNGFKVDFFWPDVGLVVETDGLRYHRTPAHQARDRVRDQAHAAAGLTPLRFTHAQVRYEQGWVERTLAAVARRLKAKSAS